MRKDTRFADRKLSNKEFANKYLRSGLYKEQYHTMQVSDGKDEREQLIINNIRWLKGCIDFYKSVRKNFSEYEKCVNHSKKTIAVLTAINTAILIGNIIILWLKF